VKTALICGVSGQDGAYLAELLLQKGMRVVGTSRDAQNHDFANLRRLSIRADVETRSMMPTELGNVMQVLSAVGPDEIYNLSGQSSVGLSFEQPTETFASVGLGTLNLLEALRTLKFGARFYNACSGECFGDTGEARADELTPFRPRSPYGVAKASAFWTVANYREAYNLYACSGILFNHESPLRPRRFVTRKITQAAKRIALGVKQRLVLGNLAVSRDWGWAPDYVEAMWRMLQVQVPEDFVIATGKTHSLEEFVDEAFRRVGLNYHDHVDVDPSLFRPADIVKNRANPKRAAEVLGWEAKMSLSDVVQGMLNAESSEAP